MHILWALMQYVCDGMDLESDFVDFGAVIGALRIYQCSGHDFSRRCETQLDDSPYKDNTGLRIYTGANALIRLLGHCKDVCDGKCILELGCGTAAVSICLNSLYSTTLLIATDGNKEALEIAALNCCLNCPEKIVCMPLSWTLSVDINAVQQLCPSFDVLIGSELMYYSVNVTELVTVVSTLSAPDGLFLHAHIFRKHGQFAELVRSFVAVGWSTLLVDIDSFIAADELTDHPEWYSIKALVSGPPQALRRFEQACPRLRMQELNELLLESIASVEDAENDIFGSMTL